VPSAPLWFKSKLSYADWFFIVALLLFATGLRFTGLTYGKPDPRYDHSGADRGLINVNTPIHPDEFLFVTRPLRMLLSRQYNPKFFHNPSFLNNVNFVTFWLTDSGAGLSLEDHEGVNARSHAPFPFYVIGRTYSALGGIVAVAATYAAARRLGGRYAALVAGLLAAVSLPLVQHAHYTTTSSLAAGFAAVTIWASFASLYAPRRWMFWLAGIAAGFAAGNRYNAALVGLVVLMVGLILLYRDSSWRTRRTVLIGWLFVPATFVFTTPWIIFDTQFFLDELRFILSQYLTGESIQFTTPYGLWFEYQYLIAISLGVPAALAALIGLYAAWQTRPQQGSFLKQNSLLLVVLLLVIYLAIYSLVNLRTVRPALSDQMLVPIIPPFALLAGLGAGWLYHRLFPTRSVQSSECATSATDVRAAPDFRPASRVFLPFALRERGQGGEGYALILTLFFILIPLIPTIQLVYQFAQPDTRQLMQQWVYEHLPRGSHIHLLGPYNVPLDSADFTWTQSFAQALISIEQLRGEQPLTSPVLRMAEAGDFVPIEQLSFGQIDYVIVSDAWFFSIQRSGEYVPAEYIQEIRDYLASLDQSFVEIARIERPIWTGYEWFMQSASYWHNPTLVVYCLNQQSCSRLIG